MDLDFIPKKVIFPWGAADHVKPAYAAIIVVEVKNSLTLIELALSGNATLDLTTSPEQRIGDRIIVKILTIGAETLTFGEGAIAPDLVGVAGKNQVQELVFDGIDFIASNVPVQIN